MNQPIAPLDLMWFLMETQASPTHVGALLIFEKLRNRPRLVHEIVERYRACEPTAPFDLVPELAGVGVPRFRKASSYDPRYHVQYLALPDGATHDDALRLVADLHEPMLDRDRPLFRVWLIDNLPGGRFALYTKIHHAIADGISTARRIQASLLTTRSRKIPPPLFAVRLPERRKRPSQALMEKITALATLVREQSVAFGDVSLRAIRKRIADLFASEPSGSAPFMAHAGPMNGPLHMARSYATLTLPFSQMRAVGKHYGATLNDVAVTIVDDAVHHYLRDTGRAFPHRLIAMLPMSLRDEGDSDSGTKVSAMFAPLGTSEATVVDRLHEVRASVASAKQEMGAMSKNSAMVYAVAALGLAELAAVTSVDRLTRPLANLVISNVPGAREAGFLGGAPLVGAFPISAIAASIGLNVTFTSNHERMDFGFVGDGIAMRDLSKMANLTRAAFEQLRDGAGDGSPGRGRAG